MMSNMSNIIIANEKSYIFISYAHKDMDEVFPIIEELQQQFCLWYDEGIDPGTEWDDNIAEHIENCTIMLSFISQAYLDSENCKDELNYARDLGKKRLLIYIEDVKLPGGMSMRLGRQQAIYYHKYFDKKDFFSKLSVIYEIEECRVEGNVSLSVTEGKTELEPGMISERQTDDEPSDQWEQYNLGYSYEFGTNGVKDYKKAVYWYMKSAEQGHSWAQYAVGFAYEFGKGVCVDFVQAVAWYRKSANQGNAWSQNRLGDCFFNGNGVEQDYREAVKWYEMAAQQNDVTACSNLEYCYRNGYGVIKDISTADYWSLKAKI